MSSNTAASRETGGLFAAIDANDAAAFVKYLTDDAVFRFGSAPAVQGRAAIQEAVGGFFETIAGCSHNVTNKLERGATLVCEGEVTYRRHNGTEIALPFTDVFEYDGDLIGQYKIYMDISPLYAE
ncbi:MAG: nuclear transport factor 2 family protein [Gammaproteobacteria bacterium]|nr:nuclear transport factor 2 family protein [Gammaproteobacteria bacterium]